MKTIDINCDLGEGIGNDELLMPYISSANIACGYHAGDENTIKQTVALCKKYNVAVGAHPSFPDTENFGRTDMLLPLDEVYELVKIQIALVQKIAKEYGATVHHVKPHGALYNMAAREKPMAAAIALSVIDSDRNLVLFGLSNSCLVSEGKGHGLKTASEVFADRTYKDDGSLSPRHKPGALIETTEMAVSQVLQMVKKGTVTSVAGKKVPIKADTICIHGDGEHAVEFAKAIHEALVKEGVGIKSR